MWYWTGGLLGLLYFVLMITLGIITIRKGHWVMFIIGIFFPLLWIIGALMPPKNPLNQLRPDRARPSRMAGAAAARDGMGVGRFAQRNSSVSRATRAFPRRRIRALTLPTPTTLRATSRHRNSSSR